MPWQSLTEGWSGDLDFTLKANGVVQDLTGATVELILKTNEGRTIETTGNIAVITPAAGLVRYSPDGGDFQYKMGPYTARFKVTFLGGRVVYFPNGAPDSVPVYAA